MKPKYEPRRNYVDYKPMSHLHLSDTFAPGYAEHWLHVEAVKRALKGRGFPFYDIPSRPLVARPPFSEAA